MCQVIGNALLLDRPGPKDQLQQWLTDTEGFGVRLTYPSGHNCRRLWGPWVSALPVGAVGRCCQLSCEIWSSFEVPASVHRQAWPPLQRGDAGVRKIGFRSCLPGYRCIRLCKSVFCVDFPSLQLAEGNRLGFFRFGICRTPVPHQSPRELVVHPPPPRPGHCGAGTAGLPGGGFQAPNWLIFLP